MIYGIYCIFDNAAGVFTAPTIDISDASAVRNFQKMCADANSMMNFKPDDFALYQVGCFNVETGEIVPVIPPCRLRVGSDGEIVKGVKIHEV